MGWSGGAGGDTHRLHIVQLSRAALPCPARIVPATCLQHGSGAALRASHGDLASCTWAMVCRRYKLVEGVEQTSIAPGIGESKKSACKQGWLSL